MDIFDDGFGMEEALTLAGAIGFAEESIRLEEDIEDPPEEEIEINSSDIEGIDLKLIYNMNPDLYKYVANTVRNQKIKWENDRLAREAVAEELAALEETEPVLEDMNLNSQNFQLNMEVTLELVLKIISILKKV